MFELTKNTLLKLTSAAIFIGGLTIFASAQTTSLSPISCGGRNDFAVKTRTSSKPDFAGSQIH